MIPTPDPDGSPSGRLYLEDLYVGQTFKSGVVLLTAEAIKAFAAQYDPQPFHLDEEAARHSVFNGLVGSGWQTAALSMRLVLDSTPFAGGIIGTAGEIGWPNPTRPGDQLHVISEVLEVTPSRSKPSRGSVLMRIVTRNQKHDAVQRLQVRILVLRRPQISSETSGGG